MAEKRQALRGPRPAQPVVGPTTQGSPLNTVTAYDKSGAVSTKMPLRGVDIGPEPDFWADLDNIARLFAAPKAMPAQQQAAAVRMPAAMPVQQQQERAAAALPKYDYEPIYGTLTYPHGSAGHYQQYVPGMPLGTGQQPVAMGHRRVRRG